MNEKIKEYKFDFLRIGVSTIMLILSFLNIKIYNFDLSWIAVLLCAVPLVYGSILALIYEHDIKADILVSIAIIASILIGEVFAAGEIATIMEIGGLLEEITVSTTEVRIEKLVELQPAMARVLNDNKEKMIDALDIKIGDIVKILPGETVPVDGVVIKGNTTIDQAILTGESIPVDKEVDDEVYAGTINNYGTIIIKVTINGEDNSLQKLIKLIENVNTDDSKVIRQADKWANVIVIASFTTALLTWIFTGEILRAVTVLVVFCPCALILATPTAIVATIGNLSQYGILVESAEKLESMFKVDEVLFDKTGTITTGIPKVTEEQNLIEDEKEALKITASLESYSEHPIAKTIINYYNEKYDKKGLYDVDEFEMEMGMGLKGKINNKICLIGNDRLFDKYNKKIPAFNNLKDKITSSTAIYTYYDDKFIEILLIQDTPKEGMKHTMQEIKDEGYQPVLLTGDNPEVAKDIANQVGIDKVEANCLPETKLEYVENEQSKLKQVIMMGDGINDASAMKKADVGIAMGDVGSDITISSADIVFINDDVKFLPYLLNLSRKTLKTINIGITCAMTLNVIAVVLGIIGILTPITGALVHNVGSVLVIIFAARLFREKPDDYILEETSEDTSFTAAPSI